MVIFLKYTLGFILDYICYCISHIRYAFNHGQFTNKALKEFPLIQPGDNLSSIILES